MGNKLINETYLTDTANAIRTKLGVETKYKPSEFANAILSIPSGSQEQALCFSVKNGDITLNLEINGTLDNAINLLYKKNDGHWTLWFNATSGTSNALSLNNGDKLYVMNLGTTFSTSTTNYCRFITSGNGVITLSGNINSLINYSESELPTAVFAKLFYQNTHITLCGSLKLPSTLLGTQCYTYMFDSCSNLLDTPSELPATIVAQGAYQRMFNGCSNLRDTMATLPATKVNGSGYAFMFQNCNQITKAPEILATELDNGSFSAMFKGCIALTTAPSNLYATSCNYGTAIYANMFNGCSKLTTAPIIHLKEMLSNTCLNMFNGCISLKITDNQASGNVEFLTIPSSIGSNAVRGMFSGTGGTYTNDPVENGVYYYYK